MSSPKVLMVDDEGGVLNAYQRLLRNEAFDLMLTTSPEEALQKVQGGGVAVVLSDQRMPGMEGAQLLEKIREISPDTVRIIMTGYADTQAAIDAINRGAVYRFLTKPWNDDELRATMRQAVARFNLVTENKLLQKLTQEQNVALQDLNQNLERKVVERTAVIAGLNKQLEQSFLETVRALAGLAELHSTIVGSHSKRVAALARELGSRIGLTGRKLFELDIAAMLHDIGKIAVPAEILSKPESALTPAEKALLRRHVINGEAVLKLAPSLQNLSSMVRHHHERLDGAGYPDGLQGDRIPLGARIIAVADAFDKALNNRASFESATPEKALRLVQHRCPHELDAEIVAELARQVGAAPQVPERLLEAEIRLRDLRVGMVLSRDLTTAGGILLLAGNHEVTANYLEHILNFQGTDPVVDSVFVYRKRAAS